MDASWHRVRGHGLLPISETHFKGIVSNVESMGHEFYAPTSWSSGLRAELFNLGEGIKVAAMDEKLEELLSQFTGNTPAPAESLTSLEQHFGKFGKKMPADLREVLEASDGAEGSINKHYPMLWGAAEIIECDKSCEVDLYAPGLILFGSNGGGEAYGFDTRPSDGMPVVKVPFIGMALEYANVEAPTFTEFLEKLAR
jgi:hypothetical protein